MVGVVGGIEPELVQVGAVEFSADGVLLGVGGKDYVSVFKVGGVLRARLSSAGMDGFMRGRSSCFSWIHLDFCWAVSPRGACCAMCPTRMW